VATSRSIGPSDDPGEIDEVVDAITYLEQAGFVAGEILHVDGGLSAGH
jgi:NAD(P)-dependent dehydrogenase (short-subunit alcohol dehydrogenase family)